MLSALVLVGALAAVLAVLVVRGWLTRRALDHRLAAVSQALESLQHAFSRFAPPVVVDEIIAGGVSNRSEKKEVTILFADLKDFTALSERLDPGTLVAVLNGYFERMSGALGMHGGHLAKFIGDGFLALFGALESNPWQANDAVHAALTMRTALADYNSELAGNALPALAMGIGIHRGTVVTGVLGSAELKEYGVIGRVVNLAARVEALTRTHGVDLLVTGAVREALDPRFRVREMPPAAIKGVVEPIVTFAVESFESQAA
jgi:class 3 adenylate cyclase